MSERVTPKKLMDIVVLRGMGYTNSQIAERLGISVSTVEYHVSKLREKAEELGDPYLAFARTLIDAGPDYLARFSPFKLGLDEVLEEMKRIGEKGAE